MRCVESSNRPRPGGIQAKRRDALDIAAVINAALEQRPKDPKLERRPYCFGSPDNRRAYYEQSNELAAAHERSSKAYLAGRRDVEFPLRTYPPPVIAAAA